MSKGNSELLSKHQAKIEYTTVGVVGSAQGFEVLKELTIKVRNASVNADHKVVIEGRMAIDDIYEEVGVVEGSLSKTFHIANFDYIRFYCVIYDSPNGASLRSSGFFNDGMFAVSAIKVMNEDLKKELNELNDSVCKLQDSITTINKQIELITDHEEDEVK